MGDCFMDLIYCVEDDEGIRDLITYAVKSAGFEAEGFESASDFEKRLGERLPSMVLLDIMLPDKDGIAILKDIRNNDTTKNVPVIMITAKGTESDKVKGFEYGADDYITKPFNILEVKARIRAIIRRSSSKTAKEPEKVLSFESLRIDLDSRRGYIDDKEVNLTAKEFDLLELLMLHPNKVYSREELLNTVWGYDYPGDARTVDVHIRRLREKIEQNPSEPKYVHTKWGVGYYFQD